MKLAISTDSGKVSEHFGRCPEFTIVKIENIGKDQMGGAGITAGQIVANEKVDAIITTNLGPRAFSVFEQFKIKAYQGQGKIKDVVQDFINGKSKELKDATGPQHVGLK